MQPEAANCQAAPAGLYRLYTLSLHGPTCPVYIYCLGIDDARYTNGCEPASCCAGLGSACCLRSPSQCAKAVRTRIQSVLVPNEQTSVYRGAGPEDPRTREHGCSGAALSILYIYIYIYIYIYGYCPHDSTDRGKHPSGGSEHAGSADIVFRFEFNEWSSAMQKPAQVLNPNMYDPTENTQAASAVLTYAVHALISLYCPPQHKFTEALNPPIHDPAAAGEAAVPVQTLMCCSACPCC